VQTGGMATRTRTIEDKGMARDIDVLSNDIWNDHVFIRQTDGFGVKSFIKVHRSAVDALFTAINEVLESESE
jgi:hypothetical protein